MSLLNDNTLGEDAVPRSLWDLDCSLTIQGWWSSEDGENHRLEKSESKAPQSEKQVNRLEINDFDALLNHCNQIHNPNKSWITKLHRSQTVPHVFKAYQDDRNRQSIITADPVDSSETLDAAERPLPVQLKHLIWKNLALCLAASEATNYVSKSLIEDPQWKDDLSDFYYGLVNIAVESTESVCKRVREIEEDIFRIGTTVIRAEFLRQEGWSGGTDVKVTRIERLSFWHIFTGDISFRCLGKEEWLVILPQGDADTEVSEAIK